MICNQCGHEHAIEEIELTFARPDEVAKMDDLWRRLEVQEDDDLCVVTSGRFFVRAVLPLQVEAREQPYNIGIWVEIERKAFRTILDLWSDPRQADEPPILASIANLMPTLPDTMGLRATMRLTGPTTRPTVHLVSIDHPLFSEQSLGISAHRAHEYSSSCS
ncbi:MAG: DUF2199 domain-containing protein [Gallionella sp.]